MLTEAGNLCGEKLIAHVQNLTPEIRQLTILPTDLCNYRCKMCHIWGETSWGQKESKKSLLEQLDVNVIRRFVDEVLEVNKKINVVISGGEPMLYKYKKELLEYLRSKKIPVFLLTNGSLIKDNIDLILKNVIAVNVSVDGPEEFHDSVRGKNSFQNVCENIELLINEKKKSNRVFPYINLAMAVSQYNYKSARYFMDSLRERFKNAKIVYLHPRDPWRKRRDLSVRFSPLIYTNHERGSRYAAEMKEYLDCDVTPAWEGLVEEPLGIDAGQLKSDLDKLWYAEGIDASDFIDIYEYFNNMDNLFGRTRCLASWHELTIRRNGDVFPCVDIPDYNLGNIYKSSFKEIWEGERINKFRDLLKERSLSLCNRCNRLFADSESY